MGKITTYFAVGLLVSLTELAGQTVACHHKVWPEVINAVVELPIWPLTVWIYVALPAFGATRCTGLAGAKPATEVAP